MQGEPAMEEHDHKAQTCDMWGHIIKEPLPTKADDRPKATSECDRGAASAHICRPQLSSTDRKLAASSRRLSPIILARARSRRFSPRCAIK